MNVYSHLKLANHQCWLAILSLVYDLYFWKWAQFNTTLFNSLMFKPIWGAGTCSISHLNISSPNNFPSINCTKILADNQLMNCLSASFHSKEVWLPQRSSSQEPIALYKDRVLTLPGARLGKLKLVLKGKGLLAGRCTGDSWEGRIKT